MKKRMWGDLPPEILRIILLKLPIKSLIKCITLSKHHHSLITSPEFINAHIKHNTISNTHLLLRYSPDKLSREKFVFEADDENFSGFNIEGAVELPFEILNGGWFHVLGCINGVICLVNDLNWEGVQYRLWNPSIRKIVEVPRPLYDFSAVGPYESVSGFMFDPKSQDYKVVRVVDAGAQFWGPKYVEVYSVRSGCWRDLGSFDVRYELRLSAMSYMSCFLNGCVNWVVSDRRGPLILKFCTSSEEFGVMELPSCFKRTNDGDCLQVQDVRGMLGLIHRDYNAETCCVWVMKEYGVVDSWTKILDLDVSSFCPSMMPRAFGIRKNGEIIMVKVKDVLDTDTCMNAMVVVDPTNDAERSVGEVFAEKRSFYLASYVESMALFGEMREQCKSGTKEEGKEDLG